MSDTATLDRPVATGPADGKIVCKIDGALVHSIERYLAQTHTDWTLARYQETYPGEPLLSETAVALINRKAAEAAAASKLSAPLDLATGYTVEKKPMGEIFGFGDVPAVKGANGQVIMISTFVHTTESVATAYVPEIDPNYVFDIDLVKSVLYALERGKTMYAWGYHGTGKTTLFEQVCARTGRPMMRIQHTVNTEEAHIVGQYVVRSNAHGNPETVWQPGPLMVAMIEGIPYLADEYDFAMPSVTSVYQPVLEGKSLITKDAPPEFRVVKPHPNFRFLATGNTNGVGDESGLYQGTQMQNAANYSRFNVTVQVGYMKPDVESVVISKQTRAKKGDSDKLVKFANQIREAFSGGQIGSTVSPRELISAGDIALARGSDWRLGIQQALTNRFSRIDRETVEAYAQRIFG